MQNEVKASKPYVRKATFEDAISLSPRLRKADLREIFYGSNKRPVDVLLEGIALSKEAYSIIYEDRVIAIYGVAESGITGMNWYAPWMLASDDLKKIAKTFLRECRGEVDKMLDKYPRLDNWVWAGNTEHIKWLKWLGFTVEPDPRLLGHKNQPFYSFHKECANV